MLIFVSEYREVIDVMTTDKELRKCELSDEEWELIEQLCPVLKVGYFVNLFVVVMYSSKCSALHRHHFLFLFVISQPGSGHSCDGFS